MIFNLRNAKDKKSGSQLLQWVGVILANCTIFSYGMQTGWMSPSIVVLQSENSPAGYALDDYEISWIASTLCIAGFLSSYVYGYIADRFGRKASVIATAVPQGLGWMIKLISSRPISLIVARGLCGFGAAGCFCAAPLYTKEIADDNIRGVMGSFGMMLQSLGTLVMYALGSYLDYYTVLWIVIWLPIINTIMLIKVPESPSYLVKIGKIEEAKETLAKLRGIDKEDKTITADVASLRTDEEYYKSIPKISIKNIFEDKAWSKAVWLAFMLMTALDTGGNFAILTYASVILNEAGVTVSPELQSLSFPAVMILGSVLSIFCVEKFGRKPLFLISLLFTVLPMTILATGLLIRHLGGAVPSWVPVLSIVLCVFCYGAGLLPVPYIVMSEMFHFQIRAKLLGYFVCYGMFMCFVQIITFTPVSQTLGMHTMFYMYAGINVICLFVVYFFLPETKGKSVYEIECLLRGSDGKNRSTNTI